MTGQFYVLKVNEDYVQMSDFVKKNLGVKFENGKAFYELTQEEDLLFYKEVVQMPKVMVCVVHAILYYIIWLSFYSR